jgi:hypothetical protein
MQSQKSDQKKSVKKRKKFKLQNVFFFIIFHFAPPTSSVHNFLHF